MNTEKTILLVEDQAATAKIVAIQLQKFGYRVIVVNTGEEAFESATQEKSLDLILMDILLGGGIDGTEAAKQILAMRNIPIVFLSSHTDRETVEKVRGITRYGYVLKNSDEFVLQSSIEMAFELFTASMQLTSELSERRRVEDALRESEEKYRGLVENSPDAIAIHVNEIIVFVNNACVRLMGATHSDDLLGKPVIQFVHPDSHNRVAQCMNDVSIDGKLLPMEEEKFIRFDGAVVDVEVKAIAMMYERKPAVQLIIHDITNRKRAEVALKASEDNYRTVIEYSNDLIWTLDNSGNFTFFNDIVTKTTGLTLSKWKGQSFVPLIMDEDLPMIMAVFQKNMNGEPCSYELRFKKTEGAILTIWVNTSPIYASGMIIGVVSFGRDITERKRLERQLIQAQKIEGLGTLAGGIAHDFNNILGIITGHASLLEQAQGNSEKFRRHALAIERAADRGAALVQQLLTFARKSDALYEPIDVNDIIHELHKLFSETFPKDISIVTDCDETIPSIVADGTQVHQVIMNLCINARDAMPSGGKILLQTSVVPRESICVLGFSAIARHYVKIVVADTGSGMDADTRKNIFEPFFTTKEKGKGTGLGLAVVFGIVEGHKGHINFTSEVGKGTTFEIYFHIREMADNLPVAEYDNVTDVPGGTETILLVEDEEMLLEIARNAITGKGYTVLTAMDGEEAIEIFTKCRTEIHAVVSDFGLPKFNGYELYKKLTLMNPEIRMIIASGYIESEILEKILEDGVSEFIQKPYRMNEVFHTIRRVLDFGTGKNTK